MAYRLAEKNICDIVIKDVAEFAQHHGKALDIIPGRSFGGFETKLTAPMTGTPRRTRTSSSSPPARRASPA